VWLAIPPIYRDSTCSSDVWKAYQAVIPDEQHIPVGKETGETAHVERWNTTRHQRLRRVVRKTLSFSKSLVMHEIALRSFLHGSNLEIAILRG
jgi:IS1 family transposase